MVSRRPLLDEDDAQASSLGVKSGSALVATGVWTYAILTVGIVMGTPIVTTILWNQIPGNEGLPPSISDTWTDPPSTFISRWFMGVSIGMLFVLTIAVYIGEKHVPNPAVKSEIILGIALVGVFFFGWVPAICDSTNKPACMGNSTIHSFCAASAFILYDLSMILTAYNRRKRSSNKHLEWVLGFMALIFAIALALDGIFDYLHSFVFLIEWLNISIMAACLLTMVYGTPAIENLAIGAVEVSDEFSTKFLQSPRGSEVSLLAGFSARLGTKICATFYLGTIFASVFIGLHFGYLPVNKGQFWFISDMWAYKPGNWLSRWSVLQGAHFGFWTQLCLFFSTDEKRRKLFLVISEFALFGLSIVGVCNEHENINLHLFGAVLFFGGYDVFIGGTLFEKNMRKVRVPVGVTKLLAHLFRIALKYGCVAHLLGRHLDTLPVWAVAGTAENTTLEAVLEWVDAIAIIVYMIADVWSHDEDKEISVGILEYSITSDEYRVAESVEFVGPADVWIAV